MPVLETKTIAKICIGGYAVIASLFIAVMASVGLAQLMQGWVIEAFGDDPALGCLYLFLGQALFIIIAIVISISIASDNLVRSYVLKAALMAYILNFIGWVAADYFIVNLADPNPAANLDAWQQFLSFAWIQAYAAAIAFPQGVPYYWIATLLTYQVLFTIFLFVIHPQRKYLRVVNIGLPKHKKRKNRKRRQSR